METKEETENITAQLESFLLLEDDFEVLRHTLYSIVRPHKDVTVKAGVINVINGKAFEAIIDRAGWILNDEEALKKLGQRIDEHKKEQK